MSKRKWEITSVTLHILAMAFMLCDHLWGTIVPGNDWLTCIGRISFPIFAFLLVEGYTHTSNLRKYVRRLFLFAVISEIPFNLALGSRLFYPLHQNVLWSFLISISLIHWNARAAAKGGLLRQILTALATIVIGILAGIITMSDYYHAGILTALAFYFFRQRKWWSYLGQLICIGYINWEILGGFVYEFDLFGHTVVFHRQGFALLALIPIWLYRGGHGKSTKAFRYFCYAFYPAHLLILGLLKLL